MFQCSKCDKSFEKRRALSSHSNWHKTEYRQIVSKNVIYCSGEQHSIRKKQRIDDYNRNPLRCKECCSPLTYEQKIDRGKYCSKKCAIREFNRNKTPEMIEKQKTTLKKRYGKLPQSKVGFAQCPYTEKWFCTYGPNGYSRKSPFYKDKKRFYRLCDFTFDVYDYPNYFDLHLIKEHGWYYCANQWTHGKVELNTKGVSRDHLISKHDAYKNDYDPKIISHPANCRLVLQSENKKKRHNSSITYEELCDRVKEWSG